MVWAIVCEGSPEEVVKLHRVGFVKQIGFKPGMMLLQYAGVPSVLCMLF